MSPPATAAPAMYAMTGARVAAAPPVLVDDAAEACVPPLVTVLVMVLLPLVMVVVFVTADCVVPLDPLADVCAG